MQAYNQAFGLKAEKVTRSLDPLSHRRNSGKKKKAEEALHGKSAQTVILKDKKVVGRSTPPPLTHTHHLPTHPLPAYIGLLSKIVIYAVF